MLDNEKWTKLVQKLNEQTQDGRLKWTKAKVLKDSSNSLLKALLDSYSDEYTAFYKDKGFKISLLRTATPSKIVSTFKLEIIDGFGGSEWKVPDVVGIPDLYQTVKMQTSGVGNFIDDFLDN